MTGSGLLRVISIFVAMSGVPAAASAQGLESGIQNALDGLAESFEAGDAEGFSAFLAEAPAGITGDTMGHILYVRRQFDKAAWFFGTDALADTDDPASLNNFSALLVQTQLDDPESYPIDWLAAARLASQRAVNLAPEVAAYQNNLGNVARAMGLVEEAAAAGRRATELAPDEPLYWTNLARSLEAAGDVEGAAVALARAHALEPNGTAVLMTAAALPNIGPAYSKALQPNCNVNFRCQEICPRSIIGGLMSVSCEIDNSSAQMACQAGGPYPTSYDCREELPEYGILIPGLNSGFSIAVPGFSMHTVVDGEGNVDVRVEAGVNVGPVGAYVRGDGHYSPTNGTSFDNLGGGVRVSVLPNSPASQLASDLGHPPAHIEMESLDGGPPQINVEGYNAGIVSF